MLKPVLTFLHYGAELDENKFDLQNSDVDTSANIMQMFWLEFHVDIVNPLGEGSEKVPKMKVPSQDGISLFRKRF